MSLCALIYSKIRGITSVDDMIQIMIVGNQLLYSSMLFLARQSMLMLTELPVMRAVFERFFMLQYNESYTCNMHGDARIERYHYCMPLETLLALNYNSFILTVGIIGLANFEVLNTVSSISNVHISLYQDSCKQCCAIAVKAMCYSLLLILVDTGLQELYLPLLVMEILPCSM